MHDDGDEDLFVSVQGRNNVLLINAGNGIFSISDDQAMSTFARAIRAGRARGAATSRWEKFLRAACEVHSRRILRADWRPRSTAEAFLIQPLALGSKLTAISNTFLGNSGIF